MNTKTNSKNDDIVDIEALRMCISNGDQAAIRTLAALGYIGAAHINEIPDFAEFQKLLHDSENMYAALQSEHLELTKKLANHDATPELVGPEEMARRLLAGESMPDTVGDVMNNLRAQELAVRGKIEEMRRVMRNLPSTVEHMRERLRGIEFTADKRPEEIRKLWNSGIKALLIAIKAEDDFIRDLVDRGFGSQEPAITHAPWLNRHFFKESHK